MTDNGWMNADEIDEELPFGGGSCDDEELEAPEEEERGDVVGKCPCCGSDVVDRDKAFFCSNYDCSFALWKSNKFFDAISKRMTRNVAEALLKDGAVRLDKCKSVRTGRTFNCILRMEPNEEQKAQFSLEFPKKKSKEEYYHGTEGR